MSLIFVVETSSTVTFKVNIQVTRSVVACIVTFIIPYFLNLSITISSLLSIECDGHQFYGF